MTTRATHAGVSQCRVIWEDSSRDQLEAYRYEGKHRLCSTDTVDLPTDSVGKRHLLTEMADELGMEWDGLREKARPFRVGDVVGAGDDLAVILGGPWVDGGDDMFAVDTAATVSGGGIELWAARDCTLITPAEEVEQGEVEQSEGEWRTPEEHELADAKRAGVLQIDDDTDDWPESCRSPEDFELHGFDGYLRSAYRVPAGWSA